MAEQHVALTDWLKPFVEKLGHKKRRQMTAQTDADVSISGSGNVELWGHPTLRRSAVRGSGRVMQMP